MKFDPTIHHRRSIRLQGYDYSAEGMYFVTIRTLNGECVLGEATTQKMTLFPIGEIVKEEWLKIPEARPNVILDEYVIMPNHLHGIIFITSPVRAIHESPIRGKVLPMPTTESPIRGKVLPMPTTESPIRGKVPLTSATESPIRGETPYHPMSIVERRRMLLPMIVGQFKMNSAKRINKMRGASGNAFWQRGYYEHIIRDGEDLDRIREYILENPMNWDIDDNQPKNIRMDPIHRRRQDWSALD